MLIDLSSERADDDIASSYQFTISSASTQPTDRGEYSDLSKSP